MRRLLTSLIAASVAVLAGCAHHPEAAAEDPLAPGVHHAVLNGVDLAWHVAGRGPVMIAHPGGPGGFWEYLRMPPAVERNWTVVYLEPVGTGASGKLASRADYKMSRYVDDVEALRAHLGLEKFVLLGHSHGGAVALSYALAHGDRLSGLVLFDTAPTFGEEWQKDVESNLSWFEHEPWFPTAQAALAAEGDAKSDDEMTATFKKEAPLYYADYTHRKAEYDPGIATDRFWIDPALGGESTSSDAGIASVFDVRARLGEISAPTLILVGRKDFVCSVRWAQLMNAGIHGSKLVVLEHSGHMGHVEEPDLFAAALAEFRKRL